MRNKIITLTVVLLLIANTGLVFLAFVPQKTAASHSSEPSVFWDKSGFTSGSIQDITYASEQNLLIVATSSPDRKIALDPKDGSIVYNVSSGPIGTMFYDNTTGLIMASGGGNYKAFYPENGSTKYSRSPSDSDEGGLSVSAGRFYTHEIFDDFVGIYEVSDGSLVAQRSVSDGAMGRDFAANRPDDYGGFGREVGQEVKVYRLSDGQKIVDTAESSDGHGVPIAVAGALFLPAKDQTVRHVDVRGNSPFSGFPFSTSRWGDFPQNLQYINSSKLIDSSEDMILASRSGKSIIAINETANEEWEIASSKGAVGDMTVSYDGDVSSNAILFAMNGNQITAYQMDFSVSESIVSGYIKDTSGSTLENATVSINASVSDYVTGSDGYYQFEVTDGTYEISASKSGYFNNSTVVTVSGDTLNTNITLTKKPSISGTVYDSDDNPIKNATVVINASNPDYMTGSNGKYTFSVTDGTYKITAKKDGYLSDSLTVTIQNNKSVSGKDLFLSKVKLDIQQWMKHGTKQNYEVIVLKNGTDIASRANVTSSNTTVVSVDEPNTKLIATSNVKINKRVTITAKVGNLTVSKNVTVANRTLDNIAIMPSTQWGNTFLGIDSEQAKWGIGSEIQWIFVAILFGGAMGGLFKNEWIANGSLLMAIILFWVMGNINLGIVLSAVVYAILAAMIALEIPERTKIHVNTNDFKRR